MVNAAAVKSNPMIPHKSSEGLASESEAEAELDDDKVEVDEGDDTEPSLE